MPQLSIITVCRNQKDINDTIESVVNQTFKDFEWIVVDGASEDDTLQKLQKVKDRIDILISEPDSGIYNAMNKGIKAASGDFLLFLNGGDNFSESDILEKIFCNPKMSEILAHSDIVYGNTNMVNSDNSFNHFWKVGEVKDGDYFIFSNISHQSSFIRRELFEKFGLYSENYKICSDTEKFLVFLREGAVFRKIDLTISNHKNDGISSKNKRFAMEEKDKMLLNYYSPAQIDKRIRKTTKFFEKIFSMKNYGTKKCIFILGILIKLKRFK